MLTGNNSIKKEVEGKVYLLEIFINPQILDIDFG